MPDSCDNILSVPAGNSTTTESIVWHPLMSVTVTEYFPGMVTS